MGRKKISKIFYKKIGLAIAFLFLIFNFQNCSKNALHLQDVSADFASESESANPQVGSDNKKECHIDYTLKSRDVKILFLTDTSGSNVDHIRGSIHYPGTDKNKHWRQETFKSFVNKYSLKDNFQFGFLHFQNFNAKALLVDSWDRGVFSIQSLLVSKTIDETFLKLVDQGNTPYEKALNLASEMITLDQKQNPSKEVVYVLVMISDGEPSDQKYLEEKNGILNLRNDVKNLVNLLPGQIYLNTVFYFNLESSFKISNIFLKAMAEEGGGQYREANSAFDTNIVDTVQIPETICK